LGGGEFLIANQASFRRFAHLRYVPLPGGDASIKHPARTALAHLWQAGLEWGDDLPPVKEFSEGDLRVLRRQFDRGLNCVPSSSMGRLFDAVSALIGVRQRVSYEGQAAMELEALCESSGQHEPYLFPITSGEIVTLGPGPLLEAILRDLRSGAALSLIATAIPWLGGGRDCRCVQVGPRNDRFEYRGADRRRFSKHLSA
jgi:hydrogenase maturation protein HypF